MEVLPVVEWLTVNYGKIHHFLRENSSHFDWAIFNSYALNYQRVFVNIIDIQLCHYVCMIVNAVAILLIHPRPMTICQHILISVI